MTVLWGEGSEFGPVRVLQGQHSHGKRLWGEQLLLTAGWHRGTLPSPGTSSTQLPSHSGHVAGTALAFLAGITL